MSDAALMAPIKDLMGHWHHLETKWNDSRSRQFYETYLSGLTDSVRSVSNHAGELEAILSKIRSDCE